MRWHPLGIVFTASGVEDWLATHAALPATDSAVDGQAVAYFSSRDRRNRAHIGAFDLDVPKAASSTPKLVLAPGTLGAFDDSGVTCSCVVQHRGARYLYYSGWSLGVTVPFYFYIGLAVSHDGVNFERVSLAPVLGRDAIDPFLTASPCVLIEDGVWRMWYVSCVRWQLDPAGKPMHFYHIKYAQSTDGIQWSRQRPVCIDFASQAEYAIARPCVRKVPGGYRMWFCYRGAAYRIGCADSVDGIRWTRDNSPNLAPTPQAWDSEMQAYPWVFSLEDREYMLYNGNGYGRTGIGLAVQEAAP